MNGYVAHLTFLPKTEACVLLQSNSYFFLLKKKSHGISLIFTKYFSYLILTIPWLSHAHTVERNNFKNIGTEH